jgi:uncharacterized protein YkwD
MLNQREIKEITEHINMYRAKHSSPQIEYDSAISNNSQTWSDYLLNNSKFAHSNNILYGENLYFSYGSSLSKINQIKHSIDIWYSEILNYDFSKNSHQMHTGHFSALIWKSSTKFGIGYAESKSKCIICLNTNPVGNIAGMYKNNIISIAK